MFGPEYRKQACFSSQNDFLYLEKLRPRTPYGFYKLKIDGVVYQYLSTTDIRNSAKIVDYADIP